MTPVTRVSVSPRSEGIPIVYYGSEQGYAGGNDPNNREALWPSNFAQSGDLYDFLQAIIGFRKQQAIWEQPQVQVGQGGVAIATYGAWLRPFASVERGHCMPVLTSCCACYVSCCRPPLPCLHPVPFPSLFANVGPILGPALR